MRSLTDTQARFFETVAETVTPEVASLDAARRARLLAIVDDALLDRQPSVRRQLGTFLSVIRLAPLVRYGRSFDRLDGARRTAVLRWFESCPVALLRKGFWGLKALVFMGYYGQPEHWAEIGYAPDFDGRPGVRRA
ncbi:MAG: gluconate 2-dehydrogenase subunit 3 family protein [Thermoanaerobaculales bacterium]|nr:gluconate 2-dehydrogenase subunit 3 family protein [Thermoanaerobaculales bacterium]